LFIYFNKSINIQLFIIIDKKCCDFFFFLNGPIVKKEIFEPWMSVLENTKMSQPIELQGSWLRHVIIIIIFFLFRVRYVVIVHNKK
jgi:hypothetical protein